ncbi:MAG TPA: hypothetical protein VH207_04245 [Chthoniobacterales bacterium]|nr:hypothetical protein [Chthoniobacterales bacterium]
MRNPERWRKIALRFFISGGVTAPAAFLLPGLSPDSWMRGFLFIYGLMAIIFGGGTALFRHFDVRTKKALARGEDVIAGWRVERGWDGARSLPWRYPRKADFLHGTGDGRNLEDLSRCYHCGYETYRLMSHCPQCGRGMQSKRWSRRYGWMLLLMGLFISTIMTLLLIDFGPKLLHPSTGSTGFSGTSGQGRIALAILGAVEVFGITALGYGIWQVVTGRRSKWVIYFAVGVAVALGVNGIGVVASRPSRGGDRWGGRRGRKSDRAATAVEGWLGSGHGGPLLPGGLRGLLVGVQLPNSRPICSFNRETSLRSSATGEGTQRCAMA